MYFFVQLIACCTNEKFFALHITKGDVSQVDKEDVNEAMRLMEMSKDSLTHNNEKIGRLVLCISQAFECHSNTFCLTSYS